VPESKRKISSSGKPTGLDSPLSIAANLSGADTKISLPLRFRATLFNGSPPKARAITKVESIENPLFIGIFSRCFGEQKDSLGTPYSELESGNLYGMVDSC
jgi:hypothetical protein